MSSKREPLLADHLLAGREDHGVLPPTQHSHLINLLVQSKRFVLDSQAALYLARAIREHPRLIADAQDFVIAPFEHMWVEMPFRSFFEEVTRGQQPFASNGDLRLGFLFDGPVVSLATFGGDERKSNRSAWSPFQYVLHKPMTMAEEMKFCELVGLSRLQLDLCFWGSTSEAFTHHKAEDEAWDKEGLRSLRSNHSIRLCVHEQLQEKLESHDGKASYDLGELLLAGAGDLRTITALLLFMNRTQDLQTERMIPATQGFIHNKLRPYISHRVISLSLDPAPRFRKLVAGEGVKRRLHDVRGHYCHDATARGGCAHGAESLDLKDFGEYWEEYEPLKWRCVRCGGKRWWRREHARGSYAEGAVVAEYAVSK